MSEKTQKTTNPVIAVANPDGSIDVTAEKKSLWQRKVVAPIKKHPKIAVAVAGGVALVSGAAFLGRKTAPSIDVVVDPLELETSEPVEVEILESHDTETA